MYLSGVIVAGFLALWNVVGWALRAARLSTYNYCRYLPTGTIVPTIQHHSPFYFHPRPSFIESLPPQPPRCCHRAATVALCAAAAAPPPSCRQRCAVALSRCCHRLAAAKLPPTSAFALPPTSAFALPPLPQLPAADLVLLRYRHWRCHRCRRCFRRRAAVRWLVVAL